MTNTVLSGEIPPPVKRHTRYTLCNAFRCGLSGTHEINNRTSQPPECVAKPIPYISTAWCPVVACAASSVKEAADTVGAMAVKTNVAFMIFYRSKSSSAPDRHVTENETYGFFSMFPAVRIYALAPKRIVVSHLIDVPKRLHFQMSQVEQSERSKKANACGYRMSNGNGDFMPFAPPPAPTQIV